MQKLKEKIETNLKQYDYIRGVNMEIDNVIDYLDREFPNYWIENIIVDRLQTNVIQVATDEFKNVFECSGGEDPDECSTAYEDGCEYCEYSKLIGERRIVKTVEHRKITPTSYMKVVARCDKWPEICRATVSTDTKDVLIETKLGTETGTRKNRHWTWQCINQFTVSRT